MCGWTAARMERGGCGRPLLAVGRYMPHERTQRHCRCSLVSAQRRTADASRIGVEPSAACASTCLASRNRRRHQWTGTGQRPEKGGRTLAARASLDGVRAAVASAFLSGGEVERRHSPAGVLISALDQRAEAQVLGVSRRPIAAGVGQRVTSLDRPGAHVEPGVSSDETGVTVEARPAVRSRA